MSGHTNRFFLRAVDGTYYIYDSATGEFIGDSNNSLEEMKAQLRSIRSQHLEPIDGPILWPSHR